MHDVRYLQEQLDDAIAKRYGMSIERSEDGFSLERLYQAAGREDRVITISFRRGSQSESVWGQDLTCCLDYTERERLQLQRNIEDGTHSFGKARAECLQSGLSQGLIDSLRKDGFDSDDVVELMIGPLLYPQNTYESKEKRTLHQIQLFLDPMPPTESIRFQFGVLDHFVSDGMLLTPSEYVDYLALKMIIGIPLTPEEKTFVFDENDCIKNNGVSLCYLHHMSTIRLLSEKEIKDYLHLNDLQSRSRLVYLDERLRDMGSSLVKLQKEDSAILSHIVSSVLSFKDKRLNPIGRYPVYLDICGYIHIGLRHIKEWRFNEYFADRDVFQLNEKDVLSTIQYAVEVINDDYQEKKANNPDFKYRKYGSQSVYLHGDYYMIHIGSEGRLENFSKCKDKHFNP